MMDRLNISLQIRLRMESFMLIRELSPDVLVVVLKIYVQQQTFLKESQLVQMSLRLAYILQVHQFMLNLQEMEGLQSLWRQVQLLRLHSADHALVLEIHLLIMHSQSDIQQETSLTEKVQSFRKVRLHLLHLWMLVLLQQQRQIKDILQRLQMLMLNLQVLHIILTRIFMQTEYLTARV